MTDADTDVRTVQTTRGAVDCAVVGDGPPVLVVHGSPGGHDAALAMSRSWSPAGCGRSCPTGRATSAPRWTPADPDREQFTIDLALAANHSGPRRAGFDNDMEQFGRIESLELERITVPVLIVQGTADSDVAPECSGFAAERIDGAELVELATGTHLAFWVHPDSEPVRRRSIELYPSAADRSAAGSRSRGGHRDPDQYGENP
jgi:pimeloyl-ACP methyl ester carboxylesterase